MEYAARVQRPGMGKVGQRVALVLPSAEKDQFHRAPTEIQNHSAVEKDVGQHQHDVIGILPARRKRPGLDLILKVFFD